MRVVFIGTGEIGLPALRFLRESTAHELAGVVTQPDKPAGRAQVLTAPPTKESLGASAIPILQPRRIKDEEAIAQIRALAPEAIVVMAYGQILPRAILEIPSQACLNLHASLLPRWRGAAPIQAAIAAGDRKTGITVMHMDEGLDTGDILLAREIDICKDETGGSLHDRLAELAPEALAEALDLLKEKDASRQPQANALATYASKLTREDGRIDWKETAETIERKIRAYNPWPGTFAIIAEAKTNKKRILKIFRAGIVSADSAGLVFKAAEGAIAALEVQPEGGKRMSAKEFLHGHRISSS